MVIMASSIACGCVRTTTTTTMVEPRKMAAILQIIHVGWQTCSLGLLCTSLILDIQVVIIWHLSKQGIRWPVSSDHIAGSSLQLIEVKCFFEIDRWPSAGFSIGSRAHVWLTCWKQGRIVRKPVNANPGLNANQIITFSSFQMFLLLYFVYMVIIETENRRPNNIQITKLKSKFYFFLG